MQKSEGWGHRLHITVKLQVNLFVPLRVYFSWGSNFAAVKKIGSTTFGSNTGL